MKHPERGDLILERYEVLSILSHSNSGSVYKCLDRAAGSEVVVRRLSANTVLNHDKLTAVKEKFRYICSLDHPNILTGKALEEDVLPGDFCLVMESVEGEDLVSWLQKQREKRTIALNDVLPIIRQIASALDFIHRKNIIHRNIRPDNIMITPEGNVKILDLGISALTDLVPPPQTACGPYTSPEQWEETVAASAADQYSLAVVTYEMLSGNLPFTGTDPAELRKHVLNSSAQRSGNIPLLSWYVIGKALHKVPSKRFSSCSAFAKLLALTGIYKTKNFILAAIGILAVCLLIAAVAAFTGRKSSPVILQPISASGNVQTEKRSPRLLIKSQENIRNLNSRGLSQGVLQQLALQYGFETMNPAYVKSSNDYDFVIDVNFSGAYRLETFSFDENLKLHGFSLGADICATYPNGRLIAQTVLPSKDFRIGRIKDPIEALRATLHRRVTAKDEVSFHNILMDILSKWCLELKHGMRMSMSVKGSADDFQFAEKIFNTLKSKNLLSEYILRNQDSTTDTAFWDFKTKLQTGEIARLFVVLSESNFKIISIDYGKIILERK